MKPRIVFCGAFGFLLAALLAYSQTLSFHWDEGFHLIAAQFASEGKRPYLDFLFAQTPLNAWWNALWFRLFHPSWRLAHAVAAVEIWASILLISRYIRARFPVPEWRIAAALAAAALFGLLVLTFDFGTIAQAYAFCTLLLVAAFYLTVRAREESDWWRAALAGVLAASAAAASLLTAAAAPVLLIWLWYYNAKGNRWLKAAAFVAGAIVPVIPIVYLFVQGPEQVWFDLVQYHAVYRRVDWAGATAHDVDVLSNWLHDTQEFVLVLLAVKGWFTIRRSNWGPSTRIESRLCLWLALAIAAQNVAAHPTFPQYFIFAVPFVAVIAVAGFYDLVTRLSYRPPRAVLVLGCFMVLALGRAIFAARDSNSWKAIVQVADKVKQVTPPSATLLAPEQIYFLTRRKPPSGEEFSFAHHLDFGPRRNALLHIVPQAQLDTQIKAGRFSTAVFCEDDDQVDKVDQWHVYKQKSDSGDCTIFWGTQPR